jgi:hypothetical protein
MSSVSDCPPAGKDWHPGLSVVNRHVKDLQPRKGNPRTHSRRQIRQIADSIREFRFNNPILLDADDGIIAGHGRFEAAKLLGMTEVPTIRLADMTEAQIDRAPEDYYAPLADLRAGDTKIYLGVVHNVADRDDYRRKLALAGRYLKDFGVAAPCGLGREAMGHVPQLLADHATALALLKDSRG